MARTSTGPSPNTYTRYHTNLEPDFRGKGAARLLAQAARDWCREEGIASLTVTCAPCDEGMYRALGFDTPLGRTLAHLTEG